MNTFSRLLIKKLLILLSIITIASLFIYSQKGKVVKNIAKSYIISSGNINKEGNTIKERILLPEGYERIYYPEASFQYYIQNYSLKPFGAKVINYDGKPYGYQRGHFGVMEVPVPSNGLQQCADALIRLRAEYLWETEQKDKIGFNFTSGHFCSWLKYAEGYRPKINGNNVSFYKTASENFSKNNFYNYLNLIYMYSGTQSLYNELDEVMDINKIDVGDLLIKPGSPGHVIMVVDKAINSKGKIIVIFAQGNTPAQSVHLIKNINDSELKPWFEVEIGQAMEIPTYYFNKVKFIRFK